MDTIFGTAYFFILCMYVCIYIEQFIRAYYFYCIVNVLDEICRETQNKYLKFNIFFFENRADYEIL